MSDKCPTHSQSGGVIFFIANSVQGHAPPSPTILFHAHAWAVMPRMDEVMGIGQSDVGRSATTNCPHPLEEGRASWRTRSSDRSVNMQDFQWHLRLTKRKASVAAIQDTEAYQALWRKLRTLEAWGGQPCESAFPKPPDCTDRTLSKRAWEVQCMTYRLAIGQMCRDEGVDQTMAMSRSGGGVAELAPPPPPLATSAQPWGFNADSDRLPIWREHQEGEEGQSDLQAGGREVEGEHRQGDGRRRGHVQWLGPSASSWEAAPLVDLAWANQGLAWDMGTFTGHGTWTGHGHGTWMGHDADTWHSTGHRHGTWDWA